MFQTKEIVYGLAKNLHQPHNKYLVTLYRDETLSVLACFTTSQSRAGVSEEQIQHGVIRKNGDNVSYIFEPNHVIGMNPDTREEFFFPLRTTITFDYGIVTGTLSSFLENIEHPTVVCVMNDDVYIDLVYAMYKSSRISTRHKRALEKALEDYYEQHDI